MKTIIAHYATPVMPGHYPTKSAQDLLIEDLRRENDAALEKIEQLSSALFDLGFDPTQLP
jgi:hypothetical protein